MRLAWAELKHIPTYDAAQRQKRLFDLSLALLLVADMRVFADCGRDGGRITGNAQRIHQSVTQN
jgi:hypothetical protein